MKVIISGNVKCRKQYHQDVDNPLLTAIAGVVLPEVKSPDGCNSKVTGECCFRELTKGRGQLAK